MDLIQVREALGQSWRVPYRTLVKARLNTQAFTETNECFWFKYIQAYLSWFLSNKNRSRKLNSMVMVTRNIFLMFAISTTFMVIFTGMEVEKIGKTQFRILF